MDVITSTITGGAFGVIIYFFICNGEEKTVSQISIRITGHVGYLLQFARNSIFVQYLLKWEPFSYVSIQLRNRFLYKYGITLVSDAFVLFFISDIAASILFGILFESVIGLFCGLLLLFLGPYFLLGQVSHFHNLLNMSVNIQKVLYQKIFVLQICRLSAVFLLKKLLKTWQRGWMLRVLICWLALW